MQVKRKLIWLLTIIASMLLLSADSCFDTGSTGTRGFTIHTTERLILNGVPGPVVDVGAVYMTGQWLTDISGATGAIKSFSSFTGFYSASYFVQDGRAPANWSITPATGPCSGQRRFAAVDQNGTDVYQCDVYEESFSISPASGDAALGINQLTVSGSGIDGTYGAPQVWVFDDQGIAIAYGQASSWASDGTWVQGSPDLSGAVTGTYLVAVRNVQADGSLMTVGSVSIMVYGADPPPDECSGTPHCMY
jgi:hypothetical protein